jgi:hypothetical protein
MKIITLLLSAFFCISVSLAQKKPSDNQKSPRIEKVINSQWTFNYFPDESAGKGYESTGSIDYEWPVISLPHTWNTYETTGVLPGSVVNSEEEDNSYWWKGWGWYRKHFSVSRDYSERKVFIEFMGIQKHCKVWLNGKLLLDNKDGKDPFEIDITGYLKFGEDNLLAVAVNNPQNKLYNVLPTGMENSNLYSGICQDVIIVVKNKLSITEQNQKSYQGGTLIITPQVSEKEGIVHLQTWVKNDYPQKKSCRLQTSIIDAANKTIQVLKSDAVITPGQIYKFDQVSKSIKNPHIWSVQNPYLYKFKNEIFDGKEVVDVYTNSSGIKFVKSGDTTMTSPQPLVMNILGDLILKNKNGAAVSSGITTGEPARIVLTGSQIKIAAEKSSIVIITADIVDSKGNHIKDASNTVKWKISGPATLIGPNVYESDINNHNNIGGTGYSIMPVSNAIRSSGKPGRIHVTVSGSGLASGSFDIDAEETKPDNSTVSEPILSDDGRMPVARILINVSRLDEIPQEIKITSDDIKFQMPEKPALAWAIRKYIIKNNRDIDSTSIEFKALIDLFSLHLLNNNGQLIADDYNYNVDHFNNCRLIAGYINSTKLPPLFKEGLRKYYANAIIKQGSEKNAGDEMNWLNWIPSGGIVVIVQNDNTKNTLKGVVFTRQTGLSEIISVVYPQFVSFSEEAKERALIFISKMNPYIKSKYIDENKLDSDKDNTKNIIYTAETGVPILIPLFKFISE